MSRACSAVVILLFAPVLSAGTIRVDHISTYDTGLRLASGRWQIGAAVKMTHINLIGNPDDAEWEANLRINNIHDGSLLIGTGTQTFTTVTWETRVETIANFQTCYQGRAHAIVPGDVKQVGGNHVCTDPRPTTDIPPCDDDCQSPIVLSLRGGYHMTSPGEGVRFDIDADGVVEQVAWTKPASEVGFLALDRDGNGRIDSGAELFGDSTVLANGTLAANGFEALGGLDENGDALVDPRDRGWRDLLLWFDRDHDGTSTAAELVPISSTGVTAVKTGYNRSGRVDAVGNEFRYQSEFLLAGSWRKFYDVYLMTSDL